MNDPMDFAAHTLPSGLRVYFQRRNLDWFAAALVVGVGKRHDPPGKEECSHLLEHHLGAGTKGIAYAGKTALEEWLAGRGFEFDQGKTTLDATTFSGKAPSDSAEGFLRFLSDYARRPRLDGDLSHDKAVVKHERRTRSTPLFRAMAALRNRAMFGSHRLATAANWPSERVIDRITPDDLRAMHRRYYVPRNMAIAVVGGLREDALLAALERIFIPVRGADAPGQRSLSEFAEYPHERLFECGRRATSLRMIYWWCLPPSRRSRVILARNGLNGLLMDRLRERLHATYDVDVDNVPFGDHEIVALTTSVPPGRAARARRAIEETLRDGDALANLLPRLKEDYRGCMRFLELDAAMTLDKAVKALSIGKTPRPMSDLMAEIDAATADDVVAFARERLAPERAYVELIEG